MKRMILTGVFVFSLIGTKVFAAGEEKISRQAKEAFKKEFPTAQFAKWEEVEDSDITLVRFVYDNQGLVVYFDETGMMIASARLVAIANLPLKVSQAIRKRFRENDIIKIEELTMDNTLSYFVSVESDEIKTMVRVYYDGTVEKVKRGKKKISNRK